MTRFRTGLLALALVAAGEANAAYTGPFATFTKTAGLASILDFNSNSLALTPNPALGDFAAYNDGITLLNDSGPTLAFGPLTGAVMAIDVYHWSFSGAFSFQILDAFSNDLLSGTFTGAILDTSAGTTGTLSVFGGVQFLSGSYWSTLQGNYPGTPSNGFLNFTLNGIHHGGVPGADPVTGAFQVGGASGSGGSLTDAGSGPKEGDHYDGVADGFTVSIGANGAAAPEPGSLALLGIGLLALRRKRRAAVVA